VIGPLRQNTEGKRAATFWQGRKLPPAINIAPNSLVRDDADGATSAVVF
jgi:hypothetical protein